MKTVRECPVLYVDDAMLVLDKPAGLLSVPGRGDDKQDCLSARVQAVYPSALVVHRLDMATSGLIVMALGTTAQRHLNDAFAQRQVDKRYVAVVQGCLPEQAGEWGEIALPIVVDWPNRPRRMIDHTTGKPSLTRWQRLGCDVERQTTRVALAPVTGRSHQLRVHLKALGHPIVGDALYGDIDPAMPTQRLFLHASELTLPHPTSGELLQFTSPPAF